MHCNKNNSLIIYVQFHENHQTSGTFHCWTTYCRQQRVFVVAHLLAIFSIHREVYRFWLALSTNSVLAIQPPYKGILSGCCEALHPLAASKWPFGPEGDFAGRTDGRTLGLRELEMRIPPIREFQNFGPKNGNFGHKNSPKSPKSPIFF